ncbi:unnamed protein product [Hyaloperonospora brassicae]|uniref:WRKY19-like zinc finger domain-containing protein n=1 Tax=Hyaloperonospora brassicae TaxID=162125 RepID=A0AAV0T6L8_HYABA|nr:unnamed protein product [Hyaloperonospora brassicae]
MEWNNPSCQSSFLRRPQCWYNDCEEGESGQEMSWPPLPSDALATDEGAVPCQPTSSLKTVCSSTFANDGLVGQSRPSLSMPQLEEATELQPFLLSRNSLLPNNVMQLMQNGPPLPLSPSPSQEELLPLPQQQFGMHLPVQLASQYSEPPVESKSQYLRPPAPVPSSPMHLPHSSARPPRDYFHEGVPTLHSARSFVSTLPTSFSSLEQQQLLYQDRDFDSDMAQEISSDLFHASAMSTEPLERESSPPTIGSSRDPRNLSGSDTFPNCPSAATPLGRSKRGSALREPFTAMAVTDKPKFSPDKRKLCCVEGCLSQARAFNRCKRHGGSKRCSSPGCTKSVQSRGPCIRHGGGSRCQESGCTRASQSHGRCKLHGGGRPCIVAGCDKKAHLKRLCRKHGGGTKCCVANCDKWSQRQGMCMTHSKRAKPTGSGLAGTPLTFSNDTAFSSARSSSEFSPSPLDVFTDEA